MTAPTLIRMPLADDARKALGRQYLVADPPTADGRPPRVRLEVPATPTSEDAPHG